MTAKDYYEILRIECTADLKEVKESYRRLAFQYHPDRNNDDPRAVEKMKEINEAYSVLCDPEKRRRYDGMRQNYGTSAHDRFREGYSEEDIFRGSDVNQIFEDMARSFGFRGFDDIFKQAYGQGFRTFKFSQQGFYGKGFVIYSSGFGHRPNAERMDEAASPPVLPVFPGLVGRFVGYLLKKMLGLKASDVPKEADAHDMITLEPKRAEQGGKVIYLDRRHSREVTITIPAGIREGQKIRLKGLGYDDGSGDPPGDLYLTVEIKRPLFKKVAWFLKG